MLNPCPTPLEGDSAELTTALHCVGAQWERGEKKAALAGLADAVLIAETDAQPERATTLARALASVARAARGTVSVPPPGARAGWKPEPPTSELIPIHVQALEDVETAATIEDEITARVAAEVLEEARARMRLRTADSFKVMPLAKGN